jgi:hypothetical protein
MALFNAKALKDAPVTQTLEPGRYQVRIVKAARTASKRTSTPGIELEFQVVLGPIQSNGADPRNRHIFDTIWASTDPEKMGPFLAKIKKLAICTNFDLSQAESMTDDQFEEALLDHLLQKELIVKIKNEEYNGNLQERVQDFAPLA